MKYLLRSWTKNDFILDWFSGSGAGGQHRNKHQNCLRLTEKQSGITVVAQNHRSRKANLKEAMDEMSQKLMSHYYPKQQKERAPATNLVRTYHEVDNRVIDHDTGKKHPYKKYELEKSINGQSSSST